MKEHDGRGENEGMTTCFHGTRRSLPFIAAAQNTDNLVPLKNREAILKKDQWTGIVLSFLRRVSFPALHQLGAAVPMAERTASINPHSVCVRPTILPAPLCFFISPSNERHEERAWACAEGRYCSIQSVLKRNPVSTSRFREVKTERRGAQKTALICPTCCLERTQAAWFSMLP